MVDPDNTSASRVDVVIDTSSIDMDNEKWNKHMKNDDFFNVEKYPRMTFTSTKIESLGQEKMLVHGNLTILDHTEPVTLKVKHNKSGNHPFSGKFNSADNPSSLFNVSSRMMGICLVPNNVL